MRTTTCALVAAMVMYCIATSPAWAANTTPDMHVRHVLTQNKAASGGDAWDDIHSIRLHVTLNDPEGTRKVIKLRDLATGRQRSTNTDESRTWGFDGTHDWVQTKARGTMVMPATDQWKRLETTSAYIWARGWWYRHQRPASMQWLGRKHQNGHTFDTIKVTPQGGKTMTLWINHDTHLVERLVMDYTDEGGSVQTVYRKDYRRVGSVLIPYERDFRNSGSKMNTSEIVSSVKLNVPLHDSDFAAPDEPTQTQGH